jgi:predicted metal-dependent RNase
MKIFLKNKGLEMKYLIIFLIVMSLPLIARDKKKNTKVDVKIQTTEWMAKISSDPEMREEMIEMILDDTKGNKEEMTKFVRTIMNNPGMNSIIAIIVNSENISNQSFVMIGDSSKTMQMLEYKLSTRK